MSTSDDEIRAEIERGEELALSGLQDYIDYYGMPHSMYYIWRDFAPISMIDAGAMLAIVFILFHGTTTWFYGLGMSRPFGHILAVATLVTARRLF